MRNLKAWIGDSHYFFFCKLTLELAKKFIWVFPLTMGKPSENFGLSILFLWKKVPGLLLVKNDYLITKTKLPPVRM